jgi:hypothetical protein
MAEPDLGVRLVGDLATPWNTTYQKVEGIGFVTQLDGTGCDPPPSGLRDQLIKEMQTHDVKRPSQALASDDTAMVIVRGFIPPGAKKGDTFDIEVKVPPRTKTTSLEKGWLLHTRLREMQVLDNALHSGHVVAVAKGPVLADSLFDTADDEVLRKRGRVLSAGVVNKPRQLGLIVKDQHVSVRTSTNIGTAINNRFHYFERGVKSGVAKPMSDDRLELAVHARYKKNIRRYLDVVTNIAVNEHPSDRMARMTMLEKMLLEPTSAETSALQLEACGEDAIPHLKKGLASDDPEVRFYAAEALAYLDYNEAADALFVAARDERAFRWRALTALSVMDQFAAKERLVELMNVASAETRYGAFHAMRIKDPLDPLVRGELLEQEFVYHTVSTTGEPLIHFSRSRRPELVVFGHGLKIKPPAFLFAGDQILIKGVGADQVKISRFRPGKETETVLCSTLVDDIVREIVNMGGGYAEVLTAFRAAKKNDYLACRMELDARPRQGRTYHRDEALAESVESSGSDFHVSNPIPDMFSDRLSRSRDRRDRVGTGLNVDPPAEERTDEGFFARMTSWFAL